jgi:hypothetical protein
LITYVLRPARDVLVRQRQMSKLHWPINSSHVTDPVEMRAEALRCYLAAGGEEEDFIESERIEEKIEDTPVAAWLEALLDHPREYGPGFEEHSYWIDSSEFYQRPTGHLSQRCADRRAHERRARKRILECRQAGASQAI